MKIYIDAGHNYSGADTGAVGNGLKEQDVTFAIASLLKNMLANAGIIVKMSRNSIIDNIGNTSLNDSLNARAEDANAWRADFFISIHTNSSTSPSANGTETYIVAKGGNAAKLAEKVNAKIVEKLGTSNRGVKVSNFAVLRKTTMPAILIETAFISNASDARLLKNYQIDFAAAIYSGICDYLGKTATVESAEEMIEKLSKMVEINDKARAVKQLEEAKSENSSLYWILKKTVEGAKK